MDTGIQPLEQSTMDEISRRLVKAYSPREIYILEPIREDNVDVGILVVVDKAPDERYEYISEGHYALIGVKIPKKILVYTKEEFENYSQDSSTDCYIIKKYGKRIYARA